MPDVTASYGTPLDFIAFFGYCYALFHRLCLINLHILVSQHVKCACRLWKVLRMNCVLFGKKQCSITSINNMKTSSHSCLHELH